MNQKEKQRMNIFVPVLAEKGLESPVSPHFGPANSFAKVDSETNELTFVQNTGTHHGAALTPPEILGKAGANVVLCGGLGSKPVQLFEQQGIQVFCQASGTVADALKAYKGGTLPEATDANACQEHQH
jgi:predicted Fe-Mo cluster-binding NifX family protein